MCNAGFSQFRKGLLPENMNVYHTDYLKNVLW